MCGWLMHSRLLAPLTLLCLHATAATRTAASKKLPPHQLLVDAACCQQLAVRALLCDTALLHHHHAVGCLHGGQAVRYDQHRPPRRRAIKRLLHQVLIFSIQG